MVDSRWSVVGDSAVNDTSEVSGSEAVHFSSVLLFSMSEGIGADVDHCSSVLLLSLSSRTTGGTKYFRMSVCFGPVRSGFARWVLSFFLFSDWFFFVICACKLNLRPSDELNV